MKIISQRNPFVFAYLYSIFSFDFTNIIHLSENFVNHYKLFLSVSTYFKKIQISVG